MDRWGAAIRLIGVGFYVGISIAAGAWIGLWLDKKYDKPILIFVGLFLGIFIAGFGMYRMLIPLLGDKKEKGDS
jgi:ATP synthase protein I